MSHEKASDLQVHGCYATGTSGHYPDTDRTGTATVTPAETTMSNYNIKWYARGGELGAREDKLPGGEAISPPQAAINRAKRRHYREPARIEDRE